MAGRAIASLDPSSVIAALLVSGSRAAAVTTLWPTYHLDPGRSGNDTGEPAFNSLSGIWNTPALDGAIYAEPLVDGNNVIVATENDSLYAFDASSGTLHWGPVHLGTPRTSNFLCGNINPLGITGTPVIDGGYLYALAEIQTSTSTFEYHLAKVDPSSGAVSYNLNITPAGMDASVQQERSALAVSSGNVVIAWGGLNGDCGTYHGYVETVSESSGVEQHQWNDTSGGSEGGMWAASGPAVDAAGNIYVATGNGSSSNINNYDYGDSVLKFSPSLALQSFFAPGSPQTWASLSASDTDLGSLDPSLLSGGLLFEIGKGGRGYLLNQSGLPSNSNPGGGENYSAQVCNATSDAAFSGLAVSGSVVFVPCADRIAAVNIDSSTAFHRIWYQTSGGGSAPIVAGGLVWTVAMFGGSTLYGLAPGTGQIVRSLALPATTHHFATPAAGDGRLFVGAGNRLVAADGDATGKYASSIVYNNQVHTFSFDETVASLLHVWYAGGWNVETLDGTGASAGLGQTTDHVGTDNSALVYNGQLQDFYADTTTGVLRHAWWNGARWQFETLDGLGGGNGQTTDHDGAHNSALVYNGQLQDFYADAISGALRHAWWDGARWQFETLDGSVGGYNSALVYNGQPQDFYSDSSGSTMRHAWWDGARWRFETLDGLGGGNGQTTDHVGAYNSALVYSGQLQDFYADASGALRHAWWDGARWQFETLDGLGGGSGQTTDHVGGYNSALAYNGQPQDFYWDSSASTMRHAWWGGGTWRFETLDGAGTGSGHGQVADALGSFNSALAYGTQLHDFYYDITHPQLRHAWWTGAQWSFEALP